MDNDVVGLYRTVRFYAALKREDTNVQLLLARLATRVGAINLAREIYATVTTGPNTDLVAVAMEKLVALEMYKKTLN